MTKPAEVVLRAIDLGNLGWNHSQIARELQVSRTAVRDWLSDPIRHSERVSRIPSHAEGQCSLIAALPPREYAYLLGQYLGDGCVSAIGARGVFRLRIQTCDEYPDVRQRCIEAINAVLPANKVGVVQCDGRSEVGCYSKHWPCLFPQHGPGRKQARKIELTPWQKAIVDSHPREFVRGLMESDGARSINTVTTRGKTYTYPRYFFRNYSSDILDICKATFDLIGADWTQSSSTCLSVAKKDSVALLDTFIGPKS